MNTTGWRLGTRLEDAPDGKSRHTVHTATRPHPHAPGHRQEARADTRAELSEALEVHRLLDIIRAWWPGWVVLADAASYGRPRWVYAMPPTGHGAMRRRTTPDELISDLPLPAGRGVSMVFTSLSDAGFQELLGGCAGGLRLESRQHYQPPAEEQAYRAWLREQDPAGDPVLCEALESWADLAKDKSFRRLRIIEHPITLYTAFQLTAVLPRLAGAGEEVRILEGPAPGLDADVWVLHREGGDRAVELVHDAAGRFRFGRVLHAPAAVAAHAERLEAAFAKAAPFSAGRRRPAA
ncbi:hypothetical protein J0910_30575 [Nocardiopsis sp. CNT-189]|uniref:DUF6879 family protein n=1 Tax=Nocardiopsis oceanisediminis TaxID=2816862 RepID=UPI003B380E1F